MQKARERLGAAGLYLSPRGDVFHSGSALGACHLAGTSGTTISNTEHLFIYLFIYLFTRNDTKDT